MDSPVISMGSSSSGCDVTVVTTVESLLMSAVSVGPSTSIVVEPPGESDRESTTMIFQILAVTVRIHEESWDDTTKINTTPPPQQHTQSSTPLRWAQHNLGLLATGKNLSRSRISRARLFFTLLSVSGSSNTTSLSNAMSTRGKWVTKRSETHARTTDENAKSGSLVL